MSVIFNIPKDQFRCTTNTIRSGTLDLLKRIMLVPELEGFNLAGGTSLALQIGHRVSVDLDLFGSLPFEKDEILDLADGLGTVRLMHATKNILVLDINGVKVDFVNYKYPLLREVHQESDIRLVSLPDIGAMKLAAITGRGRKRDFTDLFFLMKQFTLSELLAFYNQKYPDGSEFLVARSLTYFDDADQDEDLNLLQNADWRTVKKTIENEVQKLYK
ncbi:MAG: nucleotidyl transferase AbiEii/AbiGii toxin family protein [Lewinellaceae bacterium]|nr:nucleotidyl transferase AbiEii/AbiGii toxin family protein [Lewinellaceae bacterium]